MRIGLVLGGGGVLGGAWEIGALQAIGRETGWDPRRADYFVGTSAGAMLAAMLASGITPELDLVDATDRRMDGIPWPLPGSLRLGLHGLRSDGSRRLVMTIAGFLPRGVLSTEPIRRAVALRIPPGWPADRHLWIVAADYRTGERVVFGKAGGPDADLPSAVAASCAVPGIYHPVEIGGRSFVDGGLHSTDNLDLLADADVELAICLNPMSSSTPAGNGLATRLVGRAEQAAHRQLLGCAQALSRRGTRVLLIEPGPEALRMMGLNLMNRRRVEGVADLGRRTVAQQLAVAEFAELLSSARGVAS